MAVAEPAENERIRAALLFFSVEWANQNGAGTVPCTLQLYTDGVLPPASCDAFSGRSVIASHASSGAAVRSGSAV